MLKIGVFNDLVVERRVDFGLYLNPKEEEVLLPSKYVPENVQPGDTLSVFVYTDSEDRPVATTIRPKAVLGECACLEVKDRTGFGVFMDWGLEKDLLVPKSEQQEKMKVGQKYVVKVCLDQRSGRLYGTSRINVHCKKDSEGLHPGKKVDLLIFQLSKIGIQALVDGSYSGMLYRDETYETLVVGDKRTGYISRIREDGKLDLTLKKPGYTSIKDSSGRVLAVLEKSDGFVSCHDKSTPAEIKSTFQMSKKEFKRTIGNLYKNGIISLSDKGIRLKASPVQAPRG